MKYFILVVTLFISFNAALAQSDSSKETQAENLLTEAKKHIENKKWRESALTLGRVIKLGGVPPTEFYFLLGKTFVRGQDYDNGKNLLDEYLKLTGNKGEYHKETLSLIEEIKEYEKTRCPACAGKGSTEETGRCTACNGIGHLFVEDKKCYGKGYETCRICNGAGRVREQNRTYTCRTCGGGGKVKCPWCSGTGLVRVDDCQTCSGTGSAKSQIYCKTCDGDGKVESGKTPDSRKKGEVPKTQE